MKKLSIMQQKFWVYISTNQKNKRCANRLYGRIKGNKNCLNLLVTRGRCGSIVAIGNTSLFAFILRFAVSESPLHGMGQSDQQLRCAVQCRTIHFFYFWRHAYESARTPPLLRKLQHQRRAAIFGAGREVALCGSHRLTAESIQTDPRPDKEPERSVTHAERIKDHSGLSSGSPAAG